MLKKENRLRKNKQFNYIYKHGEAKHSNYLTLIFIKTKSKFKVGFSVNKKVGKSVVRNKIKRRLRECFKILSPNVNKNYNYIFVAKQSLTTLTFLQTKEQMLYVLKKANLIDDNN